MIDHSAAFCAAARTPPSSNIGNALTNRWLFTGDILGVTVTDG